MEKGISSNDLFIDPAEIAFDNRAIVVGLNRLDLCETTMLDLKQTLTVMQNIIHRKG